MLPAAQRLRENRDFRAVYSRGRSHANACAVLYVLRRGEQTGSSSRRIGFVVSKKQGDAVVRNRIKRRLREAVRLRLPGLREGAYDLVFVGRSRLKTADWPEVVAAVDDLIRRAGVGQKPGIAPVTSEQPATRHTESPHARDTNATP